MMAHTVQHDLIRDLGGLQVSNGSRALQCIKNVGDMLHYKLVRTGTISTLK